MRKLLFLGALIAVGSAAYSQPLPKPKGFSLERLYSYPIVNGRSPTTPEMSPDGTKIVFGWNQTGQRRLDVWLMDYPSGKKRKIVEASMISDLPRQDDERKSEEKEDEETYDPGISNFAWSPDSAEIAFVYKGRTWLVDPTGLNLRAVIDAADALTSPVYTQDGKYIVGLRGNNLFRYDRKSGLIRQITYLSKAGTALTNFVVSPDSKRIAVNWSDSAKYGSQSMMDFSKDRATVVNIQRDWLGDSPYNYQVGIVGIDGGIVKFVEQLPRYHWLMDQQWSPDGSTLLLSWKTDDSKTFYVSTVNGRSLKKIDIYTEKAPSNYINNWRPIVWSRDSKRIYLGTDILDGKFSFRSVVSMTAAGGDLRKSYAEQHDVTAFARPKRSDDLVLVTMARSPLMSELVIQRPNGKRETHVPVESGMATPKAFENGGLPIFSDDGTRMATAASSRKLNGELYAVLPAKGRLTESQLPEFRQVEWAKHEEVAFPGPDGTTLRGVLITPPGLDKTRKYPAFISSVYANSAKLAWNGYLENYAAMELGFVVLQVDFRASWGYGGEFNSGYYKRLGVIDADEAVSAKRYLDSLGYVRSERVGIWGWSYGGFLTCMVMLTKPDVFDTGVAVASVTDWANYNEGYTRQRLGLKKEDEEVYKRSSPVYHAQGLKGNLLLVHGMLDPNVLFQDTGRLMQKLIENGKYFDLQLYPKDDHGIGRVESRPHVFATVMRYLYWKLTRP